MISSGARMPYQSHQSGIETVKILTAYQPRTATNRTNLELKQFRWFIGDSGTNTTNRTNLELKPGTFTSCTGGNYSTNRTNLELKLNRRMACEIRV